MSDSLHAVLDALGKCRRVLVTTHVRPDGDALGSVAAMVLGLRARQIESQVLLLSELPAKYEFVFHDASVKFTVGLAALDLDSFDALLVVDTGNWSQLPGLAEPIKSWPKPKIIIDHHLTQENWADAKWVDTSAAAAGEMVAELLQEWHVPNTPTIAGALFIAIVSDTGWFQFSNTRPRTFRLAAQLIEAGVDTDRLYQLLYQNERTPRLLLQARAMNSLELLADGRLAVMQLRKTDFQQTAAEMADAENIINVPLQVRSVQVSLFFVEPIDAGPIRVSLRSKGQVDVARFAERFGGGGHARAAGLKISASLQESHNRVVSEMISTI
jgi:bifunctional oligoribonuclease and PAP phosphatase NrnA